MTLSKIIKFCGLIVLLITWGSPNLLFAQDEEEEEQISTRATLSSVQKNDGDIDLNALIRARIDGRYTGLPELEVAFFAVTDSSQEDLGKAVTGEDGIATLAINVADLPRDTSGRLAFMAEFEGNDEYSGSDDDIEIKAARMLLEPIAEDSALAVQVTLMSGGEPVADEDIALFVKRLFSSLKVGEATTDEDGMATFDFPTGFPGDAQGNLEIYAFLEEHDDFGNMRTDMTQAWGIPVSDMPQEFPRALWSPYPPLWMVLAFVVLMGAVWGHYFVIVAKLIKVNKEGKAVGPS